MQQIAQLLAREPDVAGDFEQDAGAKRLTAMDGHYGGAPVGVLEEDMAAAAALDREAAALQRAPVPRR